MPSSPTWVRTVGDTAPGLTVQLREDSTWGQRYGDVVDLSNVEAVWWVAERAYDGVRVHEQQAEIIGNPHDGTVYTNLTAIMTEQSGLVRNHVLCFWGDGSMITYPSEPNVDALWLRVRERILVTTAVPVKTAGPTAGVDPVAASIFIPDGGSNTVPSNGAVVFAGANATINVAPGVTNFTVAAWPTQTPWSAGTTPTIVHAGTTQHGTVQARLLASAGDEVTIARDGLAGAVWFASAPAAGQVYSPPDPIFVPSGGVGAVTADGQLVYAGDAAVINVAAGVTSFSIGEWSTQSPWTTVPTIVQAGTTVHATALAKMAASDGDMVVMGSNGATWFAAAGSATPLVSEVGEGTVLPATPGTFELFRLIGSGSVPDALYYWNGSSWVQTGSGVAGSARMGSGSALPANGATYDLFRLVGSVSPPDGLYYWTGAAWLSSAGAAPEVGEGSILPVTPGTLELFRVINSATPATIPDGVYYWNGSSWVAL